MKKTLINFFPLCFLGILWLPCAQAADDFFNTHAQGWHWYEPEPETDDINTQPQPSAGAAAAQSLDPLAQVKAISKAVDEAKAEAVLNPTHENVERYIALQNAVTQNAANFAKTWQQVVWQTPDLNYSINHPTSQFGKQAYLDAQREQETTQLKQISQQYGLFFFFASNCPYCHKFAPIIKDLQTTYGFSVIPVSLDGGGLPEYPQPIKDAGQAAKFNVTRWPALFLVNPQKRQVIPITYGLIAEDELTHRMVTLVTELNARGNNP